LVDLLERLGVELPLAGGPGVVPRQRALPVQDDESGVVPEPVFEAGRVDGHGRREIRNGYGETTAGAEGEVGAVRDRIGAGGVPAIEAGREAGVEDVGHGGLRVARTPSCDQAAMVGMARRVPVKAIGDNRG
jgi:hypothetical protein